MIGGRMIVKDRQLLTVDLDRLTRAVESARIRLGALIAETRDVTTRIDQAVGSYCPSLADEPYHVRRYLDEVAAEERTSKP